ncbi:rpsA [Symbiodinium sp. CCMP2592]|nr:rpsA [Symbiodinium sp. CCMP2592]
MLRAPLLWCPRLESARAKQRRPLHVHQFERGQVSLAPADVTIPHARPPKVIRNGPTPLATFVVDQWAPHEGIVLDRLQSGALLVDVGCEVPGMLPADGYFASKTDELDQLSPGDSVTCYACCKYPESKRLLLSLHRREVPRERWKKVIADGQRPYEGVVQRLAPFGVFVDLGTEVPGLLPNDQLPQALPCKVGDAIMVYVVSKRPDSSKLDLATSPRSQALRRWIEIPGDGRTPHKGTVLGFLEGRGAFIDMGFERPALLPMAVIEAEKADLKSGSELTVYITDKQSKSGRVTLALAPSTLPKRSWEDIIADGQTPYNGVVRHTFEFGALVDIGYDSLCFLPNLQVSKNSASNSVTIGQELTVYAVQKRMNTGRVSLSLQRRAKPLEDLQDVCCDGRSAYRGIVRTVNEFGLFVDFGCSVVGMLDEDYDDPALIQKQSSLKAGDVVTVYPICKDLGNGRVYLSLKKRDVPICSVWDLAADGQTPYFARVVSVHGRDCTMDLGADTRGLLTRSNDPLETYRKLEVGDMVHVYIHRRNSATASLTLSLKPSPVRKVPSGKILADLRLDASKVYTGEVYCIQHGYIFLDIGSELGAMMLDTVPFACRIGDRIHVRISHHDTRRGRFRVVPVATENQHAQRGRQKCKEASEESEAAELVESEAVEHRKSHSAGAEMRVENAKGRLQELVQKATKQVLKRGDILYSVRVEGRLFSAEVRLKRELQTLMPMFSEAFEGEVQQTKQKAEHSAAQKALSALCSLQSAAERTAEAKKSGFLL